MSTYQQQIQIRNRKLGLLIYDARIARSSTVEKCAKAMGLSVEEYQQIEAGKIAPSLPQLESLAYFLDVPMEHFWGGQVLSNSPTTGPVEQPERLIEIRQRIIGTRLRMARTAQNISITELANKTFIPGEKIQHYELGQNTIPLPELEILADTLQMRMEDLFAQRGPIGRWRKDKAAVKQFLEMPPEVREFVGKPVNLPYLELAMHLSDLSADKLRLVAESLLEITF